MTRLAMTSVLVGAAIIAVRVPCFIAPEKYREQLLNFPRSKWAGRILMAVVTLWAGINLYNAATDEWAMWRPLIVTGVPVAYWLIIQYGDQFLSLRAAAALMLLIAKLMVDAADLSDTAWRLVVTVLAYLWVVAAVWMTIAPHHVRDLLGYAAANHTRLRTVCSIGIAVGVWLLILGWFCY